MADIMSIYRPVQWRFEEKNRQNSNYFLFHNLEKWPGEKNLALKRWTKCLELKADYVEKWNVFVEISVQFKESRIY